MKHQYRKGAKTWNPKSCVFAPLRIYESLLNRVECSAQLVGTAGVLIATANAIQLVLDICRVHSVHQTADSLQVAVATTQELHIP